MKRSFLLFVVLLSACAGVRTFDQNLKSLVGQPVNDVDIVLAQRHTGQYQHGAETVYVWQDTDTESVFGPSVTSGYRLGSPMDDGSEFLMSGIQFHSCVIRAYTTDNIVRDITFEGDPGGCERIYGWQHDKLGRGAGNGPLH